MLKEAKMRQPRRERQVFISERVIADGTVHPREVVRKFGVTLQTAISDIMFFSAQFPGYIVRNGSTGAWMLAPSQPKPTSPQSSGVRQSTSN